jgi:hypothetical protein
MLNAELHAPYSETVARLQAVSTGIEWLTPSGIPIACFHQYTVSLTANLAVTLTVNEAMASSAALDAAGFPYCVHQEITVTPILAITNTPLTTSSATKHMVINDPGKCVSDYSLLRQDIAWLTF